MTKIDRIRIYAIAGKPIKIGAPTAIWLCDLAEQAQRDDTDREKATASLRRSRQLIVLCMALATANVLFWALRLFS